MGGISAYGTPVESQPRRRKILVGAMMLKVADQYPKTKDFMLRHLDEFLEHPRDRALFNLAPRPNTASDGSLPRIISITISYRFSPVHRLGLGIVSSFRENEHVPTGIVETAAAVEIRTVRGFPHAAWNSLAKNARLSHRSHNADCGSHFKIRAHFSLTFALNISYLSTVPNLVGRDITSITAPIATGWSDSCRVGFAPTEDRRLFTAH